MMHFSLKQHMKYKEDAAFIKGKLAQNYSENILMQNEAKYFFVKQNLYFPCILCNTKLLSPVSKALVIASFLVRTRSSKDNISSRFVH